MAKPKPRSNKALAALILGIASLLFGWVPFLGWATIAMALVLGIAGLADTKDAKKTGRGMAIAGIVMALVGLFMVVLLTMVLVGVFLFAATSTTTMGEAVERHIVIQDEGIRLIEVSGIGIDRTVEVAGPAELWVSGIGNTVTVSERTDLQAIVMQGMNNTVRIPMGTDAALIDSGIGNQVVHYE